MMSGCRLNIGFHGNEKTPEQILMIPFRDGDDVRYFVVRDDRRDEMRNGQDNGLGSID